MITYPTFAGQEDALAYFAKYYDLQQIYIPPDPKDKTSRGPKNKMICRFCRKAHGETKFNSKPHIIPRSLGINCGVSNFECDECNNFFSRYETDLAAYISLVRIFDIIGKGYIPKFGFPNGSLTAKEKERDGEMGVEINDPTSTAFTYDSSTGRTTIKYKKDSYIPLNVYKSLLKIALSVLPWEEFINYKIPLDFIRFGQNEELFYNMAKIIEFDVDTPPNKPCFMVFKKLDFDTRLATHMVCLISGLKIYQFFMPYNFHDRMMYDDQKPFNIIYCPPLKITEKFIAHGKNTDVDLSSTIKKSDDWGKFHFVFGKGRKHSKASDFNPHKIASLFINKIEK